MSLKTNAARNSSGIHIDLDVISRIFKSQKDKRLIIKKIKANGSKDQEWESKPIDWAAHTAGKLLQGGNPVVDGMCSYAVVDLDRSKKTGSLFADKNIDLELKKSGRLERDKVLQDAFEIDNKLVVHTSPSKKAYHAFRFFRDPIQAKAAHKYIKKIEKKFKTRRYNVDPTHTLPTESLGQSGINFPWSPGCGAWSPNGQPLTFKQFVHRIKYQDNPLIAAAAGMVEPGRHTALLKCAAVLEKQNKLHCIDEVTENFGTPWTDENYSEVRIKEKKIHEKYKNISTKGINAAISDIVGYEYEIPAADEEDITELPLAEHTGAEKVTKRPWLIFGWIMASALTLLVGQPGVGKTMLLHMLAYCLATGHNILGKVVLERGNVLLIAREETLNEIDIRLIANKLFFGKNDGKFKIFRRGLEEDLKLVEFGLVEAKKTKIYKRLKLAIKNQKIKYIILDPLINFQSGNYDENSNQKMELFIRILLELAIDNNAALIAGHHTNKLSMITIVDKELLVDQQSAMYSARGASSLVAASRFVIGMQPMTRKLWEGYFSEYVQDGTTYTHYTGLIEAKSNYNMVEDDIIWLKKNSMEVPVEGGIERSGVFTVTGLTKITKTKNKLKAEKNEQYARSWLPTISQIMKDKDEITLNSAVEVISHHDERWGNSDYKEATIKSDVRRKLENGLRGKIEKDKSGALTSEGVDFDDGYNYWIKTDPSRDGAAKIFIQRGKDFKR
tara:strand:- start:4459 stop:6642 length:2184 start_codon:yes stop_codon:yes gene_type:complete